MDGRVSAHQRGAWDADASPVLTVDPGEEFRLDVPDSSTGQLGPESPKEALRSLDLDRVDRYVGPVEVRGAEPGDALDLEILEIVPGGWGWSGVFREFGFLRDRFDDALVLWDVGAEFARPVRGFLRPVEIPVSPMLGVIGVAPAHGRHPLIPPRSFGGNMDNPAHRVGSVLRLPVYRPGAMLGVGDPHAAQGDGEVCGTGVEVPARVLLRAEVARGKAPPFPRVLRTGRRPSEPVDVRSALGISETMEGAARAALENLLGWLTEGGWTEREGYLLASLVGQLRLAEVVDLPTVVVALDFPAAFGTAPDRPAPGFPPP